MCSYQKKNKIAKSVGIG